MFLDSILKGEWGQEVEVVFAGMVANAVNTVVIFVGQFADGPFIVWAFFFLRCLSDGSQNLQSAHLHFSKYT